MKPRYNIFSNPSVDNKEAAWPEISNQASFTEWADLHGMTSTEAAAHLSTIHTTILEALKIDPAPDDPARDEVADTIYGALEDLRDLEIDKPGTVDWMQAYWESHEKPFGLRNYSIPTPE